LRLSNAAKRLGPGVVSIAMALRCLRVLMSMPGIVDNEVVSADHIVW
jgi:hypothetical protein